MGEKVLSIIEVDLSDNMASDANAVILITKIPKESFEFKRNVKTLMGLDWEPKPVNNYRNNRILTVLWQRHQDQCFAYGEVVVAGTVSFQMMFRVAAHSYCSHPCASARCPERCVSPGALFSGLQCCIKTMGIRTMLASLSHKSLPCTP